MIVTVDEVKTHLRIQHDEEDDYIAGLIAQAQTAAEDYCRVSFEPEPDEEGNVPEVPQPVRLAVILTCNNDISPYVMKASHHGCMLTRIFSKVYCCYVLVFSCKFRNYIKCMIF